MRKCECTALFDLMSDEVLTCRGLIQGVNDGLPFLTKMLFHVGLY